MHIVACHAFVYRAMNQSDYMICDNRDSVEGAEVNLCYAWFSGSFVILGMSVSALGRYDSQSVSYTIYWTNFDSEPFEFWTFLRGFLVGIDMPRVVPEQKQKYENDETFRKLARESEVRNNTIYIQRASWMNSTLLKGQMGIPEWLIEIE